MKTKPEDIELIERYLHDQLTHAEAIVFETRLEEDREFARVLRLRKNFPSLFKADGEDIIEMKVNENPEQKIRKQKKPFFKLSYFVVILIILSGCIIIYFVFFKQDKPENSLMVKKVIHAENTKKTNAVTNPAKVLPAKPVVLHPEIAVPVAVLQESITLETPAGNAMFNRNDDIRFRWKQATDSFTNFYIFCEANNKLAWWRGIRPGIRECIVPANNFKQGRYFWYVGTRDNKRYFTITEPGMQGIK